MVRIRLQRSGAKKRPYYRIVAAEGSFAVDGRFIEVIGYYHPIEKTDVLKVDEEKAIKWLMNGAQPTDTVRSILSHEGVLKEMHEAKSSK